MDNKAIKKSIIICYSRINYNKNRDIYYPLKNNASLYSIYDINLTNNNKDYLRDTEIMLLYDSNR